MNNHVRFKTISVSLMYLYVSHYYFLIQRHIGKSTNYKIKCVLFLYDYIGEDID